MGQAGSRCEVLQFVFTSWYDIGRQDSPNHANHANHANQILGQNPNFPNSLTGFNRHNDDISKVYVRIEICKIFPYYRGIGPLITKLSEQTKGLDGPETGSYSRFGKIRMSPCSFKPVYMIVNNF